MDKELSKLLKPRLIDFFRVFYEDTGRFKSDKSGQELEAQLEKDWHYFLEKNTSGWTVNREEFQQKQNHIALLNNVEQMCFVYGILTENHTSWIYDYLENHFDKKIEKEEKTETIGGLLHTLTLYGCSKNQAEDAIAEWLLLSKSSVKNFYKQHHPYSNPCSTEAVTNILGDERYYKQFPKHFKNAYRAFILAGEDTLFEQYANVQMILQGTKEKLREEEKTRIKRELKANTAKKNEEILTNSNSIISGFYLGFKKILGNNHFEEIHKAR